MVRVDRLLEFVGQLHNEPSAIQRRTMLLRYIRRTLAAHFVALFALDPSQDALVLLAYSGRKPVQADEQSATDGMQTQPLSDNSHLPLHGLFGSALSSSHLFSLADLSSDPRALPVERAFALPGGPALLSVVRANRQANEPIGLLLISFAANKTKKRVDQGRSLEELDNEGDLAVCITLLSSYLSPQPDPPPSHTPPRTKSTPAYDEVDQALAELLRNRRSEQMGTLPELLYSLSSMSDLYELGLVMGTEIDIHELYQHILSTLGRVVLAQGSCLLLYEAEQHHFVLASSQGQDLSYAALAGSLDSHEMERLALRGPGETVASVVLGSQHVLLVTLSCNCLLLGVVALAIPEYDLFSEERSLLLSYMGNVAALLLKNHELRILEVQEALEQEQQRIARDIHDGPVQSMTHVLHRLENISHLPELVAPDISELATELKRTTLILEAALDNLRHDISALLPLELEEQGFETALEALVKEYTVSEPHLDIAYQANLPPISSPTLQSAIFRCIQEALNNIRKHAQAQHVSVRLHVVQRTLLVEIHDDGVGIQATRVTAGTIPAVGAKNRQSASGHFGLRSMEDRVKSVGGNLEIISEAGHGTLLKARFPLPPSDQMLSKREREILRLISQGLSNSHIALQLRISRETVKSHVHHIMQKLQAHDRTHAAIVAVRQGWL